MKYVLIILTTLFLLTSCNNNPNTVIITKQEYEDLKGGNPKYPKSFKLFDEKMSSSNRDGIVLGSDGHEYLLIAWCSNSSNCEHYIDCELCTSREKDTIK